MFEFIDKLNWIAIIIATFAYYVLGALWFTPLFGKIWDKAIGYKREKGSTFPLIYYIGPFISSLVVTIATSLLLYSFSFNQVFEAIQLGFVVGVGYAMSISFNNAINPKTPHPLLYGVVTGSYHVVGIVLAAVILFILK